jgi:hypothetical protein
MESNISAQEDLMIRLLISSDIKADKPLGIENYRGKKHKAFDGGSVLKFDLMSPKHIHTFDATDPERILPSSYTGLMHHPVDLMGNESEMGLITPEGIMKWTGFKKLSKRPRGIYSEPGNHTYYEKHYRILGSENGGYYKRVVAIHKSGCPLIVYYNGTLVGDVQTDGLSLILNCGLIEDLHRRDAYLCSIKDAIELKFSVSNDDVYELFSLREAPLTSSGRRKAIIHYVSEHLRGKGAKRTTIKEHYRGITEFIEDGLTVSVTPNNSLELK